MSKLKFNLLLVSSLLFLSSCSNIKVYVNNKDYADYEQFVLPTLENFYTINEDNYFIYLYSDSCSHCDDIKKDIFSYLEKMKDPSFNSTVLYIYNMHSNKTNEGIVNRNHFKKIDESEGKTQEQLINEMIKEEPSSLSSTYFFGTPSLYLIKNNHLSSLKIGTSVVVSSLNSELINYDDIIISTSVIVGLTIISSLFLGIAIKYNKKNN